MEHNSVDPRYLIRDLEICQTKLLHVQRQIVSMINGGSIDREMLAQINKIKKEVDVLFWHLY